jgi:hypothetical protein
MTHNPENSNGPEASSKESNTGLYFLGAFLGMFVGCPFGCFFSLAGHVNLDAVLLPPLLGGFLIGPLFGLATVWVVCRLMPGE